MGIAIVIMCVAIILGTLLDYTLPNLRNWVSYRISKGRHYTFTNWMARFVLYSGYDLNFKVVFTDSCRYDLPGEEDQFDVNKLYGIAWGLRGPKHNSARIGWTYNLEEGNIDLFLYTHHNGKRDIEWLGNVSLYEEAKVSLHLFSDHVSARFNVNGSSNISITQNITSNPENKLKFRCFPYFGGNRPAPHDIKILLREGLD
jgi:hypothetical protein